MKELNRFNDLYSKTGFMKMQLFIIEFMFIYSIAMAQRTVSGVVYAKNGNRQEVSKESISSV